MFERFTDRARRVVVLAQEEARMLNHNYIGTEHILLGLIHEGEGVAAKALESLGTSETCGTRGGSIWPDAGASRRGRRVARRRHRREHGGVLVDPGDGAAADARRRRRRPRCTWSSRAPTPARIPACRGSSTAICDERLRALPDLFAFRMVPFNVGERGRVERRVRPARVRQLLLGARPDAGARPIPPRRTKRDAAGGEPVVVISYDYWQTRFARRPGRARPHAARQRSAADDRRRHAGAVSGHGARC